MKNLLFSSVGRKLLVGLTAVGVAGFILIHVGGNMLLFVGPEAFNRYSYHLTKTTALLYPAELCLGLLFAFHFFLTGWLTLDNWKARPIGPSTLAGKLKRASLGIPYDDLVGTSGLCLSRSSRLGLSFRTPL